MLQGRGIAIWSIVGGIVLNNLSYLIDLMKDHTGVIMIGTLSAAGILAGIALILYGTLLLVRRGDVTAHTGGR